MGTASGNTDRFTKGNSSIDVTQNPRNSFLFNRYFRPISSRISKAEGSRGKERKLFFTICLTPFTAFIFRPLETSFISVFRSVHSRFVSEIIRIRICRKVNFSRPGHVQSFRPFLIRLKIVKTKRCKTFGCSRMHILGVSTRRLRIFVAYESSMDRALVFVAICWNFHDYN